MGINGKRLKALREQRGLYLQNVADFLGITRQAYMKYESGETKTPRQLDKLANFFNVTTDYLLGNDEPQQLLPDRSYIKRIPVLGAVRAGIPIDAIEEIEDWEEIDTRQHPFRSGTFFALRVTGDSMEPTIHDGDVVIVRQQPRVENGEIGIVTLNGDTATVKEVKESSQGITLIGHNAAVYTPHFYDREEVESLPLRVIGKAVELRRKL